MLVPPERAMYSEGQEVSDEEVFRNFLEERDAGIEVIRNKSHLSESQQNKLIEDAKNNFREKTENISDEVKMRVFQQRDKDKGLPPMFQPSEPVPPISTIKRPDHPLKDKLGRRSVAEGSMLVASEMEDAAVPVDTYPNIPPEEMAAVEASQLPDEQMEDDYVDFVMSEALNEEEQMYLMNTLEADPQLSMIFDKVVTVASEFSGSGEVTGPGTGVSDSIPARLSDGEFVMTKKATDQIGADNLQLMMDDAERAYDGGLMKGKDEEEELAGNMNKVMMSAIQMPSLNVRQRSRLP